MMSRSLTVVLASALVLAACSPTFNWREVRAQQGGLRAMLPCKPESDSRQVPMAGREVELSVLGCDAGGATFAVLSAHTGAPQLAGEVLGQWKAATLVNMRSTATVETPFRIKGAFELPQSLQVISRGRRPDGSTLESHAAYFARGAHVFQAIVYADQLKPEATETFFSGLSLE